MIGSWKDKQRQFRVYFFNEDISGHRALLVHQQCFQAFNARAFLN
uniref:DUF2996 domain-containing protein n=1 Tax=Desertifilum tharense IPPAS B-1220 TaxID=1781255 RepID=A0ACD5H1Z0_9CYAN